jgi:hypothetical protein
VHALVIGVSKYPPYPSKKRFLSDIPGAALGAATFAEWLAEHYHHPRSVPLLTVRVLLAPVTSEINSIVRHGVRYLEATTPIVRHALRNWSADCDASTGNIAILYVAGHGIVTANDAVRLFLSSANEADPYEDSIDLDRVRRALRRLRAQSNIFVFDCCAKNDQTYEPSGGLGLPILLDSKEINHYQLTIAGSTIGGSAYVLGARSGTLLSAALVPLLFTAGEIKEERFSITRDKLDKTIGPKMAELLTARSHQHLEAEPRIRGEHEPEGLHCPTPPPTFILRLVLNSASRAHTATYVIRPTGHRSPSREIVRGEVSSDAPREVPLTAGTYSLETTVEGESPATTSLNVIEETTITIPAQDQLN